MQKIRPLALRGLKNSKITHQGRMLLPPFKKFQDFENISIFLKVFKTFNVSEFAKFIEGNCSLFVIGV